MIQIDLKRKMKALLKYFRLMPYQDLHMWSLYTKDAIALAQFVDCDAESIRRPQQQPEKVHSDIRQRTCNWYLPVFDNAFYGGVMTILRLANYLYKNDGVAQRFIICGASNPQKISSMIVKAFPSLINAEIYILDSTEAIQKIPFSDYSVATLWTTAYVLLKIRNTGYKFYMIQDFEPLFYPAGSTYAQANLTYYFNFYGITNTCSLKKLYEEKYNGQAITLVPNIDTSIFYSREKSLNNCIKKLFYYARPDVPRNGFELAVGAIKLLKQRMGESVEILCAGANWDPIQYGLTGFVHMLGMLPYEKTGELYRSCHVGLVMMMTEHPSYLPFELMACGTLVVSNLNSANTWFLRDKENCLLSYPSVSCLAETLYLALTQYDSFESIRKQAAENIAENHGDWDRTLSEVVNYMHSP